MFIGADVAFIHQLKAATLRKLHSTSILTNAMLTLHKLLVLVFTTNEQELSGSSPLSLLGDCLEGAFRAAHCVDSPQLQGKENIVFRHFFCGVFESCESDSL